MYEKVSEHEKVSENEKVSKPVVNV